MNKSILLIAGVTGLALFVVKRSTDGGFWPVIVPVDKTTPLWNPYSFDSTDAYKEYVHGLGFTGEVRVALRELFGLTDEEILAQFFPELVEDGDSDGDDSNGGGQEQESVQVKCPHCGAVGTLSWERWAYYNGLEAHRWEDVTRWDVQWHTGETVDHTEWGDLEETHNEYWHLYCTNCQSMIYAKKGATDQQVLEDGITAQKQTFTVKRWTDTRTGAVKSTQTFEAYDCEGKRWKRITSNYAQDGMGKH